MKKKITCCILSNELDEDHQLWVKACDDFSDQIDKDIVKLTKDDWLEKIRSKKYDVVLATPPGLTAKFKQLYDERIHIMDTILQIPIYPTPTEIYIYENKRYLYSWLKANRLPHPETHIFYYKGEANEFIQRIDFPIVAKVNIGASGSGVKILHNKSEAKRYIYNAFFAKGIYKRWGPNFAKGNIIKRGFHYILNTSDIRMKVKKYKTVKEDIQKGFVIFQEYIIHDFEWRIVAIGDSYFAHKKLKIGEKASGSTLKKYENPSLKLFDFAREIMVKFNFTSQAIDVFETADGELLINEMQCIFGQSDPYQMLVNGKPGRYRFINGQWVFEEGNFNQNESYNLRVEHVLRLFQDQ